MSKPDLLAMTLVAQVTETMAGRTVGQHRLILAFAKLRGGGKESDFIAQELAKNGWQQTRYINSTEVPSQDPLAEAPIVEAMTKARNTGFSFLVYSAVA
jgi:hypothetical protein